MSLSFWTVLIVVVVAVLHLSTAQFTADVSSAVVKSRVGYPANFTCRYQGVSIATCLWERKDFNTGRETVLLNVNAPSVKPGEGSQPGYVYFGSGLQNGECGVFIERVREKDGGKWQCSLITDTAGVFRGAVQLDLVRKAEQLKFVQNVNRALTSGNPAEYGDIKFNGDGLDTQIACLSVGGRPTPAFQWYIDTEPIRKGLGPISTIVSNGSSYTYQTLHHAYSWRDNGKRLRCVVSHEKVSTPTDDDNKVMEITLDIKIDFSPRAIQYVPVELGKEKMISVMISANPKPHTVIWTIDDDEFLLEREGNNAYDAERLKEISPRLFQANFKIKVVSENDLTKQFLLKVVSEFGVVSFEEEVRLTIAPH